MMPKLIALIFLCYLTTIVKLGEESNQAGDQNLVGLIHNSLQDLSESSGKSGTWLLLLLLFEM